jgi:hypothetical protein
MKMVEKIQPNLDILTKPEQIRDLLRVPLFCIYNL